MKKLKLSTFTPLEEVNYREMLMYIYDATITRIKEAHEKGYLNRETFEKLTTEQQRRMSKTASDLKTHITDPLILEKVIRLHAIGIERKYVKELYAAGEVSETVIKRIMSKLEYQSNAIEHNIFDEKTYEHKLSFDIFEYLADTLRTITGSKKTTEEKAEDMYLYYRALSIVSRKVVKELNKLNTCFATDFTAPHTAIQRVSSLYDRYREGSVAKMHEIKRQYPTRFASLDQELANRSVYKRESIMLHNLSEREMVTPKVSIALAERFENDNRNLVENF